jgi:hypothetical protein
MLEGYCLGWIGTQNGLKSVEDVRLTFPYSPLVLF